MSISKKFRLCAFILYAVSALLTKMLAVAKIIVASDVMITGSDSIILQNLPNIFGYASDFFNAFMIGVCVASISYAMMYFGTRTSFNTAIVFVFISLICTAAMVVFSILYNSYDTTQILAFILTAFIDWMYSIITALGVTLVVMAVAGFRKKPYSHIIPNLLGVLLIFTVKVLDLTFTNVVPFLTQYTDITKDETLTIISDYAFYIIAYLILPFALSLIITAMLRKATGALKLKLRVQNPKNSEV